MMLLMGTTYRLAALRQCSPTQTSKRRCADKHFTAVANKPRLKLLVCVEVRDWLFRPRQLLERVSQVLIPRARTLETPRGLYSTFGLEKAGCADKEMT